MRTFKIETPDRTLHSAIQTKIDNLNKPKGSLGRLEELATQICLIQQTLSPELSHPCHLLLGGDHGIEREGVSISPREVTWQQMINFTHGGGGVNMFCRQHGFKLRIVDVGVDYDLSHIDGIINRKIARGTKNFLYEPAMTEEEYDKAIETGVQLVDDCIAEGCKILCMIFTHCGDESGHRKMLDIIDAKPLLSLGLRLGEGTGALCAYPIIDSAVRMINEMNNFDNANITKYF